MTPIRTSVSSIPTPQGVLSEPTERQARNTIDGPLAGFAAAHRDRDGAPRRLWRQRRSPAPDAQTLEDVDLISDVFWDIGTEIGTQDGSLALRFYEASIAYGLVAECREVGATPIAGGTPTALAMPPITCPPDPKGLAELKGAPAKGMSIAARLLWAGAEVEDIELVGMVNAIIWQRVEEIEVACGLRPAASPVASPAATPAG